MKHVLLICGSGASSGFMAAAIRKAAKKKGEEISVKAASEAQLDDRLDEIDTLLIGPHLAYIKDDVVNKIKGKNIKVAIIPQLIYGSLNGAKALDLINDMEE
ncbi:PTS lactose transporter subunit IIB [Lacticaseibacillus paracasei]|uniref:PTS lactose transporter subunit IIB n=1 Tax=Lacticaseibacillus paracasei TaxID=1597 RepID=A0ABD6VWU4_LACPA|nr:PTS sugar transporter subunit IIB [Lacticaseibacillus paracasei]POE39154.1 PTS lactose transporter subunit IIB [Lacticaseibacillus paracasei]